MPKEAEETHNNTKLEELFEGYKEEDIESRYPDFDWGYNYGDEIIE